MFLAIVQKQVLWVENWQQITPKWNSVKSTRNYNFNQITNRETMMLSNAFISCPYLRLTDFYTSWFDRRWPMIVQHPIHECGPHLISQILKCCIHPSRPLFLVLLSIAYIFIGSNKNGEFVAMREFFYWFVAFEQSILSGFLKLNCDFVSSFNRLTAFYFGNFDFTFQFSTTLSLPRITGYDSLPETYVWSIW